MSITEIEFFAQLPATRTAITFSGDDPPTAALRIEIPASEAQKFPTLLRLTGKPLIVTIKVDETPIYGAGG